MLGGKNQVERKLTLKIYKSGFCSWKRMTVYKIGKNLPYELRGKISIVTNCINPENLKARLFFMPSGISGNYQLINVKKLKEKTT